MISAPPVQQYDVLWTGRAHRNLCVPLKDGKATVTVGGMPDFQLYFAQSGTRSANSKSVFAQGLESGGKIEIDAPDAPHTNGTVCLGVANGP